LREGKKHTQLVNQWGRKTKNTGSWLNSKKKKDGTTSIRGRSKGKKGKPTSEIPSRKRGVGREGDRKESRGNERGGQGKYNRVRRGHPAAFISDEVHGHRVGGWEEEKGASMRRRRTWMELKDHNKEKFRAKSWRRPQERRARK